MEELPPEPEELEEYIDEIQAEAAPPISKESLEVLRKVEVTSDEIQMEKPLEEWDEIVKLLGRKNHR